MAGNAPKFKVGDRVLHRSIKDTGIGVITRIETRESGYFYSITWKNVAKFGKTCCDPERDLRLVNSDEVCVQFGENTFYFPQKVKQETIFNEILKEMS